MLLNVRASTANYIVYEELGKFPLEFANTSRLVNVWTNLACSKIDRIAAVMYTIVYNQRTI
jgi:hypothetical protein